MRHPISASSETPEEVGAILTNLRTREALTQQEAAKRLDASLAAYTKWESGASVPSPEQRRAIDDWAAGVDSRPPSVFASRGVRDGAREAGPKADFHLLDRPGAPVLEAISSGSLLQSSGNAPLEDIIARHAHAAPVADAPPSSGMSAGKNTYTYDAHTYHTKVPPQGIAELLRHYLPEGGLVLDPFAGSGMTGVAASATGMDCVLNELSPAASFIASRFVASIDGSEFWHAVTAVLDDLAAVRRRLYTTDCRECGKETELLYVVWSYRVQCPNCSEDFLLWDHCRRYGANVREHKILSEFPCPGCEKTVRKAALSRSFAEPVQVGYICCGHGRREVNHPPSASDLKRWAAIEAAPGHGELGYPVDVLPPGVNLSQPIRHGLTSIDKFYTARNLSAMSNLWSTIHRIPDAQMRAQVAFAFTGLYRRVTRLSEFRFWGGSGNSARLNVPFIFDEANVFKSFERKAKTIRDHLDSTVTAFAGSVATRVGSATDLAFLSDNSVDLVFTDPPFGANINYSEMNLLWESWLGRKTDATNEAIVSRAQGKDEKAYGRLMSDSLKESYRVLRPGSWMLLVFMNSSASIWRELSAAIEAAGFLIVSADIFDKQHGTFKHFVSPNTPGADLVLHCLKPVSRIPANSRSTRSLDEFLNDATPGEYRQGYLHVDRDEEVDVRRLYSEWLASAVVAGEPVIDFSEFRKRVLEVWESNDS